MNTQKLLTWPQIPAQLDYWKAHEGRCLGCGLDISIQDQYCGECESFLSEMYDKGDQ